MKRLDDMSREDLLTMTDEMRSELADLESAYEGIPLLPPRPEKPEIKYPSRDVEIYTVDNHDFSDLAEAQWYVELVSGLKSLVQLDREYGVGDYDCKFVKREKTSELKLETKKVYSLEAFNELKSEIVRTRAKEEAYNEQNQQYKNALSERTAIYKKIDDAISAAWESKRIEDALIAAFNKYVSLTGDSDISLKLLKDAYKLKDDTNLGFLI